MRVEIQRDVLLWAIERTQRSVEQLATVPDFARIQEWVSGESQPTFTQAKKLAARARIPFGYLLLDEPVDNSPKLVDFRTVNSEERITFSPDLEGVIKICQSRLSWYAEMAGELDEEPSGLVGSFRKSDDSKTAARKILENLDWRPGREVKGRERVLDLADAIQAAGILVMRSSVVGSSTARKLRKEEFRGFSLIQAGFALIFVNGDDFKVGQLFSLAHELGHILLGSPGVSGERNNHREIERWCNSFASELIFPSESAVQILEQAMSLEDASQSAYKEFGVSSEVFAWTLVDCGRLSRGTAEEFLRNRDKYDHSAKSSGRGNYFNNLASQYGYRFADAVTGALAEGIISTSEGSRQLGIKKTSTLNKVVEHFQGVGIVGAA